MERIVHVSRSFADADRWDREQQWSMTAEERHALAAVLRERYYGVDNPDVRESTRQPGGLFVGRIGDAKP